MRHCIYILFFICLLCGSKANAQEFYTSINNYNKILINPSYAGEQYKSNIWTSYSVFTKSDNEAYSEFTLVYDRYAPRLKGGTTVFMKQGLQSNMNLNTLEFAFSYAPRIKRLKGKISPSAYVAISKPVKQWFVYGFDEWRNNFEYYKNIPGRAYLRPDVYKIGASVLVPGKKFEAGIFGVYGFQLKKDSKIESSRLPYKLIIHINKKGSYRSNGVLSRSNEVNKQLILHYENGLFQVKSEILVIGRKFLYSAYMLNNISDNIHVLGGSFGLNNKDICLIIAAGLGSTPAFDRVNLNSHVSLRIKLPRINIARLFPFKPLD